MKETKMVACTSCGKLETVSKFASTKNFKCPACKTLANVGDAKPIKSALSDYTEKSVEASIAQTQHAIIADISKVPVEEILSHHGDKLISKHEHLQILADKKPNADSYITIDDHKEIVKQFSEGCCTEHKPLKVLVYRNRGVFESDVIMDTGEINDRVPTDFKVIENTLDYLSVSKVSTYQKCPAAFHEQFMFPENPEEGFDNKYTQFGTVMHSVMERVVEMYEATGIQLDPIHLFNEYWAVDKLTDYEMYKDGIALVEGFFTRNPIYTLNKNVMAIEVEYRGTPFPEAPDLMFGCMMDLVYTITSNGQNIDGIDIPQGEVIGVIADYKTNRRPFTLIDLQDSIQLSVYEIIARIMYPEIKYWITGYEVFRFGWQQCPMKTERDLEVTKMYLINLWNQIKNDNSFEEKLNPLCWYCYRKDKCFKYADLLNNPNKYLAEIMHDGTTIDEIDDQYQKAGAWAKIFKGRADELGGSLKSYVEEAAKNGKQIIANGEQLFLQAQSRPFYDYNRTRQVLAMHGKLGDLDRCISVNKTKLDEVAKKDKALALELQSKCLVQTYSSPYLMRRKP